MMRRKKDEAEGGEGEGRKEEVDEGEQETRRTAETRTQNIFNQTAIKLPIFRCRWKRERKTDGEFVRPRTSNPRRSVYLYLRRIASFLPSADVYAP